MSTLAERQLAAWQAIADTWQVKPDDDGVVLLCQQCGKGIMLIYDRLGRPYGYLKSQRQALVVLHLRNHHPDLDPDR